MRLRRYGGPADALAAEALERDTWSSEQWTKWQQDQLARMLWHAARNVPFYRSRWEERRRAGDRASVECIENWPVLEKDDIRANFERLRADHSWLAGSDIETTSGTTGNPIRFLISRKTSRSWYALCEARFRRWNGISRHDRWAMVGAQLVAPVSQTRPPFWVWNAGLKQLYMSAYHLSPANTECYLDAMQAERVQYLWGHSSALDTLARAATRNPALRPNLRVVLSSSEPLTARQRANISQGFGCPVRATYGMSEMVVAASECATGQQLHLWPDAGYAEVVNGILPVRPGTPGDLVATSLLNWDMPLIRYRIGDRITLQSGSAACACGRCLPVVERIEGRISDMLYTASGAAVSPSAMEVVFDFDAPILESQIVQLSLHQVRVLYVPAGKPDAAVEAALRARIQARLGDIEVQIEAVAEIPRGPNGKFRAVMCRLRREDIASLGSTIQPAEGNECVPTV
jgi:phenylacetate-CoA ligase